MSPGEMQKRVTRKAQVFLLIDRLREVTDGGNDAAICEASRQLKNTVDYAWDIPEVFTPELVDQIIQLLRAAAAKIANSPFGPSTVQRADEFSHQLQSILAARATRREANDSPHLSDT